MKTPDTMSKALLGGGLTLLLVFTLVGPVVAQDCVQPPPSLVSWWPGDSNTIDIIDGNHGTLQGGGTFVTGMVGQAFRFANIPSANNQFVEVANSPNIDIQGTSSTLDNWVLLNQVLTEWTPISAVKPGSYGLWYNDVGQFLRAHVWISGSADRYLDVPFTWPVGSFVHVAQTYDSVTEVISIYVNGVLVGSGKGIDDTFDGPGNPLLIGKGWHATGTDTFAVDGLIDEVEIYNRALSAEEIGAIFTAGSAGKCQSTITVDTTDDELNSDGDCSLREAIQAANTDAVVDACPTGSGTDTVIVPAGTYTLSIAGRVENANVTGDLDITADLIINGAGAANTIIDGSGIDDRVFHVKSATTVSISGLTVQNANVGNDSAGGILNDQHATLMLTNVTVSGNSGFGGGGIQNAPFATLTLTDCTVSGNSGFTGAGILNAFSAILTVTNSTVSGNSTSFNGNGGGIDNGSAATLTLTNSTVSGNSAGFGGGILNFGSVTLTNATVTDNSANFNGSGIFNGLNPRGTVTLKNTIVANSFINCSGPITSAGHNLDSGNTCGLTGPGDLTNINPLLGPLQDNGGVTFTHALLPGSPAIGTGSPDCPPPATDQRGVTRPQGATCDIGAYELSAATRAGFNSNTLPANDDGSTGLVPIGFTANFFGAAHDSLFVNNNGNVTFDFPLHTYTPFGLTSTGQVIIAPFFADVDTRVGNVVTFGTGTVNGRPAFGVNWPVVGCFDRITSVLNFFQVVLINRDDIAAGDFDIEFNYDQVQWETGTASSGDLTCQGGSAAHVGFSNGTGALGTFFELPGSGIPGSFLDTNLLTGLIHNSRNSNQLGRYIFNVRSGVFNDVGFVQPVDSTTGTTPVGIMFFNVSQGGTTSLTTSNTGPTPPSGFQLGSPPIYYELATTAVFSGPVTVCINYPEGSFTDESNLELFHFENGAWEDRTVSLDTTNNIICASATSLSPFAIFESIGVTVCFGKLATIIGTPGDDNLKGTASDDVIVGLGGNDIIKGRGGNDLICGGAGNDNIDGGDGDNLLDGGSGDDFIRGRTGKDFLDGGSGSDSLDGGSGNDILLGGVGDDRLLGRDGNDALDGGSGNDSLDGGSGNDTCINGEKLLRCEL